MYAACPELHTLLLTCCGYLAPDALDPLLRPRDHDNDGPALPELTTLDVSYCPLPGRAIADLLTHGSRLEVRVEPAFARPRHSAGSACCRLLPWRS